MGLWVEIMCDKRIPWSLEEQKIGRIEHRCHSDANNNPSGPTVGAARAEARERGWAVGPRRKACCPACQNPPAVNPEHPHD